MILIINYNDVRKKIISHQSQNISITKNTSTALFSDKRSETSCRLVGGESLFNFFLSNHTMKKD